MLLYLSIEFVDVNLHLNYWELSILFCYLFLFCTSQLLFWLNLRHGSYRYRRINWGSGSWSLSSWLPDGLRRLSLQKLQAVLWLGVVQAWSQWLFWTYFHLVINTVFVQLHFYQRIVYQFATRWFYGYLYRLFRSSFVHRSSYVCSFHDFIVVVYHVDNWPCSSHDCFTILRHGAERVKNIFFFVFRGNFVDRFLNFVLFGAICLVEHNGRVGQFNELWQVLKRNVGVLTVFFRLLTVALDLWFFLFFNWLLFGHDLILGSGVCAKARWVHFPFVLLIDFIHIVQFWFLLLGRLVLDALQHFLGVGRFDCFVLDMFFDLFLEVFFH